MESFTKKNYKSLEKALNYHKTTKMKPADVDRSMHNDFNKENIKEGLEVKVANNVGISIYKNILQNISCQIGLDLKVKKTVPWTYVISDLNGEKIGRTFYEKEFQKRSLEKVVNYMLNGKETIIRLIDRWIKRHKMNDSFFFRNQDLQEKECKLN